DDPQGFVFSRDRCDRLAGMHALENELARVDADGTHSGRAVDAECAQRFRFTLELEAAPRALDEVVGLRHWRGVNVLATVTRGAGTSRSTRDLTASPTEAAAARRSS